MSLTIFCPETDKQSARYATMLGPQLDALKAMELQLYIASPDNLRAMRQYALEQSQDYGLKVRQRGTWKRIAALIKQEMK